MLAQNFKTAADLDLTEAQHAALIKTLALLDGGKLTHAKAFDAHIYRAGKFTGHFNMAEWTTQADCGTRATCAF